MKVTIPDELKSTIPQTPWGKILSATPIVMAVLATMLAGLASSEMTKAQYDRSLAAQQQSKAGDQWSFFQAKRLRAATQRGTLDLLTTSADIGPLNAALLKRSVGQLPAQLDSTSAQLAAATRPQDEALGEYAQALPQRKTEAEQVKTELLAALETPPSGAALTALEQAQMPEIGPEPSIDPNLKAAMAAINSPAGEKEVAPLVAKVNDKMLDEALTAAKARADAFDAATAPVGQVIGKIEALLARQTALLQEARAALLAGGAVPNVAAAPNREFIAARLRYMAARYDMEAKLNQAIGQLYEVQVRKSNLSAERHHVRSQRFFFGMLAAQLGVIVSTFAIAARKRSLLWSLAAAAGLAAVAFGAYVYLFV